jgi:hypothetical protein
MFIMLPAADNSRQKQAVNARKCRMVADHARCPLGMSASKAQHLITTVHAAAEWAKPAGKA